MINKITESSQKAYMTSALKKALAYWKDAEPNLDKSINKIIDEILNNNKWYGDKTTAIKRIYKDNLLPTNYLSLKHLSQPNVI